MARVDSLDSSRRTSPAPHARTRFGDARFRVGVALLGILVTGALLWPFVSGADANGVSQLMQRRLSPPFSRDGTGAWHLLGTDAFGRDITVRLWLAARISLGVGVVGSVLAGVLGALLGALAAWRRGVIERGILAVSDAMLAVPRLVLLLVAAALWGPGLGIVIVVLALTGWMSVMRLVRADVLRVRVMSYVEGASALGVPGARVLWRHVMPNAIGSAVVAVTIGVGNAILLESGLSFLGLGVQPPTASWGNMIAGGRDWLLVAPWIALSPGLLLILTVIACTLVGDALGDAHAR